MKFSVLVTKPVLSCLLPTMPMWNLARAEKVISGWPWACFWTQAPILPKIYSCTYSKSVCLVPMSSAWYAHVVDHQADTVVKTDLLNIPFIWYIPLNNHRDISKLLKEILYACITNTTYPNCKLNTFYHYSLSKLSNKANAFYHIHKPPFVFSRKK